MLHFIPPALTKEEKRAANNVTLIETISLSNREDFLSLLDFYAGRLRAPNGTLVPYEKIDENVTYRIESHFYGSPFW